MTQDIPKQYDPAAVEKPVYRRWLEAKAFAAVPDARGEDRRYVIMMPLPNVTGALHGPRDGQHDAGPPRPLAPDGG